jgi:hypothetical protein
MSESSTLAPIHKPSTSRADDIASSKRSTRERLGAGFLACRSGVSDRTPRQNASIVFIFEIREHSWHARQERASSPPDHQIKCGGERHSLPIQVAGGRNDVTSIAGTSHSKSTGDRLRRLFVRRQLDDEPRVEVAKVVERSRCISSTLPTAEKLNQAGLLPLDHERGQPSPLQSSRLWFAQSNIMPSSASGAMPTAGQVFEPPSLARITFLVLE